MKLIAKLHSDYQCEHGESAWQDSPRVRFNGGFHDGQHAMERGWTPAWKPAEHHDPVYVAAYFAGQDEFRRNGGSSDKSDTAWDIYCRGEYRDQMHLFFVETEGDHDDLEVVGATIPEEEMAVLLGTDGVTERQLPGVIYARNQNGTLVEVMADMDSQSLIARAVDMTPEGPVYLNTSDELADNSRLKV